MPCRDRIPAHTHALATRSPRRAPPCRLTNRPRDMLVPSRRAARKGGDGSGGARWTSRPGRRAEQRRGRRVSRRGRDDRSRRPDGRRQDQDRPPPGGAPQSAVFRFGQRDRGRGRRDHRGDFPQSRRSGVPRRRAPRHRAAAGSADRMSWRPAAAPSWTRRPAPRSPGAASRYGCAPISTCWWRGCRAAATARCCKHGDPRAVLAELIERRHPVYAEADIVVDSGEGSPEVTTNAGDRRARRLRAGAAAARTRERR